MKIALAGAAGFLARYIVRRLAGRRSSPALRVPPQRRPERFDNVAESVKSHDLNALIPSKIRRTT